MNTVIIMLCKNAVKLNFIYLRIQTGIIKSSSNESTKTFIYGI